MTPKVQNYVIIYDILKVKESQYEIWICKKLYGQNLTKIWVKNGNFYAIFHYRRIGRLGRIFGTEYSAFFGRIFGRIFGIRSYTSSHKFKEKSGEMHVSSRVADFISIRVCSTCSFFVWACKSTGRKKIFLQKLHLIMKSSSSLRFGFVRFSFWVDWYLE